jgi:glycosyltransferase involved in cell wall biosynthesis
MIGAGPLQGEVRRSVEALFGKSGALEVVGEVNDPAPWYRRASLLVLTSEHEGTPNVVMEAMASGIVVATTPVGGVRELLGEFADECVAERDDEDALYQRVRDLIRMPERLALLRRSLRRRAVEQFSLEALAGHLSCLYRNVLSPQD